MKKIIPLLLIISFLLCSCQLNNQGSFDLSEAETTASHSNPIEPAEAEIKGVWISCYDHISAAGKTKSEYESETDKMFKAVKETGFNTAFVHMRAFSDSFYKSEIYPYSSYIAGQEGAELDFDPFEILLSSAKKYGISVHGWINPFRVSTQNDIEMLSDSNPAKQILNSGNSDGEICVLSNGIYYNPSHTENHKRIYDGIREIISKYEIDGIHIDDYFYPSTDESVDEKQYSQYKTQGGSLTLSQWRTTCVNAFVSGLYSAVKAENTALTVSISPAAQLDKNYSEYYADCKLWISQKGYADIIIPQIYFGFEHETLPFEQLLNEWSLLEKHDEIKLLCGIGAYKCAAEDEFAGSGASEWIQSTNILARQLKAIRANQKYSGFVMFSYKDILRAECQEEIKNLRMN